MLSTLGTYAINQTGNLVPRLNYMDNEYILNLQKEQNMIALQNVLKETILT